MFKAKNKDTRTMSMASFWYVVIVKSENISHLFLVLSDKFRQLDAC